MNYEIKGTFNMGLNRNQKFKKEVEAENDEYAREKIYSILGSKHGVKRSKIQINSIEKLETNK
ncbi:MAG: Ribosomal protein L20A [Candidatus Methanohalarchaeum thermophilum]|uniref:Large ribosomal subunit protein eL20 n=1 Tax=Methanohalarchaeum thermophilum TaxID=1903181 RepID=A0A1Q6DXW1_METT1|nr:MAG: Ribosomal protein L20A [Candidatus Methanohalarchaeum thermophilum]